MDTRTLLDFMNLAEKLKCRLRHSWTSDGRQESVAEHTFRLCMFAWLVRDEIEGVDMDRVMQLCLFHDIGEAVTGDIPAFEKNRRGPPAGEGRSEGNPVPASPKTEKRTGKYSE